MPVGDIGCPGWGPGNVREITKIKKSPMLPLLYKYHKKWYNKVTQNERGG